MFRFVACWELQLPVRQVEISSRGASRIEAYGWSGIEEQGRKGNEKKICKMHDIGLARNCVMTPTSKRQEGEGRRKKPTAEPSRKKLGGHKGGAVDLGGSH